MHCEVLGYATPCVLEYYMILSVMERLLVKAYEREMRKANLIAEYWDERHTGPHVRGLGS